MWPAASAVAGGVSLARRRVPATTGPFASVWVLLGKAPAGIGAVFTPVRPLVVPAAACLGVALLVHWLTGDRKWWVTRLATGGSGMIAYAILIVPALPADERLVLRRRRRAFRRHDP